MTKNKIIEICLAYQNIFRQKIADVMYESRGIFNSEMLLCCALSAHLGVDSIWESGRARGQSTKILACFFNNTKVQIHSVEKIQDSSDEAVAKNRLLEHPNIHLLYGGSFEIIPAGIKNSSVVLIDGPKANKAARLAKMLIPLEEVKAVLIHDCFKGSTARKVFDREFPDAFFSDDIDFVNQFKHLDLPCWKATAKKPYYRGESYSDTICAIL